MNRLRKPLKEWFGYTHRERRAALILLILCILIISLKHVVTGSDDEAFITMLQVELIDIPPQSEEAPAIRASGSLPRGQMTSFGLELNLCDSAALEKLPGIGPVLSARIIKYRNLLGGYADKRQLLEVYGLPPETYDRISSQLTADTTLLVKIPINSSDYRELVRHPYLSPDEVSAILRYRQRIGRIEGWQTITRNNLVTSDKAGLLRFYISYE
jgi:DNA uptake protein ComE-like DNA-binding protein